MSSVKRKPVEMHVCEGCGRNDTPEREQLCKACKRAEERVCGDAHRESWRPCPLPKPRTAVKDE